MKIRFKNKKPLYRYIPIARFLDMLETNHIGLVKTNMWEDPFEGYLFDQYFEKWPKSAHKDLKKSIYCLCFSKDMEKDQIWKSYTPNYDGVRIKLNLCDLNKCFNDKFILGAVEYKNKKDMKVVLKNLLKDNGKNIDDLRDLFFYKLLGFQNDKEIRLLTIDTNTQGDVKNVDVNICDIITDIRFDPRMDPLLFKVYKDHIKKFYPSNNDKLNITQSTLYTPKKHLR